MAILFEKDERGRYYNKIEPLSEHQKELNPIDKISDILITYSMINYCLAEIVYGIKNREKFIEDEYYEIKQEELKDIIEKSFLEKLSIIEYSGIISSHDLVQVMKKLNKDYELLTNTNYLTDEVDWAIFASNNIIKMSEEGARKIEKREKEIDRIFNEYTSICEKFYSLFNGSINNIIKYLTSGEKK